MNARMGAAMRAVGFERKQVRIKGKSVKGYVRGEGETELCVDFKDADLRVLTKQEHEQEELFARMQAKRI